MGFGASRAAFRQTVSSNNSLNLPIVWLAAAAADRRRIVRYISGRARDNIVAVAFMDRLMQRIEMLGSDVVQFRPGRISGTREYAVHRNYIVVYRVNAHFERVEILRLWSVWNQPLRPGMGS